MAQGCVRAGVAAAREDGPAEVSEFVSSIRARPGGGWAGYRRRPRAGAARARQEAGRSQAAGPRLYPGAEAEAACHGCLTPNRGIEPTRSGPGIVAHFTPCTPLPARYRGGAAPDRSPGGVAQDREFAQLSAQGKPISSDVDSLSSVIKPKSKNNFRAIFATFQTNSSETASFYKYRTAICKLNQQICAENKQTPSQITRQRGHSRLETGGSPMRQRRRPETCPWNAAERSGDRWAAVRAWIRIPAAVQPAIA